ncbi:DUF2779 domain-containing protein [Mycoplasma ovis]|nr:DUF2779 domain-containing protein [Mycoplasma ovis]
MKKAQEASNSKDFLSGLFELWDWKETNLSQKYYFFKGTKGQWEEFLEHKKKNNIDSFFVYCPEITINNFSEDGLDLILNPSGLFFSGDNLILFLFSYSANPNSTYLPEFLFYHLCFQKYLNLEIQEFFITWFDKSGKVQISNYLPSVKKVNKLSNPDYLKISELLGVQSFEGKLPLNFVEKASNTQNQAKDQEERIFKTTEIMKKHFSNRIQKLTELSKNLLIQLPENLKTLSEWHKSINWVNLISLDSLESNYQVSIQFKQFEIDTSIYKKTLKLLYPSFSIISFSLWSRFKGVFELIKELNKNHLTSIPAQDSFWDSFLSFSFSKYSGISKEINDFFLSREGLQRLSKELLEIKWKVYYDFESYEETLTQLSIQIFSDKNLYLKENLILESKDVLEDFEKQIIYKLAIPLLKYESNSENEDLEYLKKRIVYISFNKSFECEWLKRLAEKYKQKNQELYVFSNLIKSLTMDLSDWFKFSKNLSLNLISPLGGAHSLKKLTKLVAEKKYSEIELVQEGRAAQLLFFYFYLLEDKLSNHHLSSKHWIIKENNSSPLKEQLKEYCELDVENMVLAVKWLEKEYKNQEGSLVNQRDILSFISWIKDQKACVFNILIQDYINWKLT